MSLRLLVLLARDVLCSVVGCRLLSLTVGSVNEWKSGMSDALEVIC